MEMNFFVSIELGSFLNYYFNIVGIIKGLVQFNFVEFYIIVFFQ